MAKETNVGAIKAKLELDANGFNTEMEKAKASMTNAAESTKKTNQQFRQLGRALSDAGVNSKQIRQIQTEMKNVRPELLEKQLRNVELQMRKLGATDEEIAKVKKQIEDARKETAKMAEESEQASKKTGELSQNMDKSGKSATEMSAGMKQATVATAALTTALIALIAKSVETSAAFEQSMAKVGAITQASFTDFMDLRKQAIELGTTTVFSASQAAEAQSFLAMAGFEVKEIMESLPGVLSLAAAGQMELGRTADIASNILTGFRMSASETNRVVDVMAATMTRSNTNIEQLGYAMKYAAPVAAATGIEIETAAAAIGKLSDAGIQGEMAGTQLRAILLRLIKPVGEAANVMNELGIRTTDAQGNILPFTAILRQLETAFAGLTESAQAEAAALIAGTEATAGFLTLLSTGADELDSFSTELQNSVGTADRIARQQMDTLNGSIEELKSALEGVGITVGDTFSPAIRAAVDEITNLLNGFNTLDPAVQRGIISFGAVVPAIMGVIVAVRTLSLALKGLSLSFPLLLGISAIVGVVAGLASYISKTNEASEAAKEFAKSQSELNDVLRDTPSALNADQYKQLQSNMEQLNEVLKQRIALEKEARELEKLGEQGLGSAEGLSRLIDIGEALRKIDKELKGMGYESAEQASAALRGMEQASRKALGAVVELTRASMQEEIAHADNVSKLKDLAKQYDDLNKNAKVTEEQKAQLADIVKKLKQEYPDLNAQLDEENRWHIANRAALDNYITGEENRVNAAIEAAKTTIQVAKTEAEERVRLARESLSEIERLENGGKGNNPPFAAEKPGGLPFLSPQNSAFLEGQAQAAADKAKKSLIDEINKGNYDINQAAKLLDDLTIKDFDQFRSGLGTGSGTLSGSNKSGSSGGRSSSDRAKTSEQLAQEAYRASLQWIEKRRLLGEMNEEQELAALNRLTERYKNFDDIWIDAEKRRQQLISQMDSDEKKRQDEALRASEKEAQDRFNASAEWIDEETRRMTEKGASEREIMQMQLDAWTRVRSRYDKDSEYFKRADKNLYDLRMSLRADDERAAKEAADEAVRRTKDYTGVLLDEIEKQRKAEHEALDKRKDEVRKYYDDLLKIIDNAERGRDRASIVAEMEKYQYATSEKGQKRYLELKEQLRKHDLEDEKRALQDERDEKLSSLDQQKKDIDSWYSDLKNTIDGFSGDFVAIYKHTEDERFKAFVETNQKIKQEMENFKREMESINASAPASGGLDAFKQSVVYQMKANSTAWHTAAPDAQKRLSEDNQRLGASIGATYKNGIWYLDGLPLYHTGGKIGEFNFKSPDRLLPNELAAIFEQGEFAFTQKQVDSLATAAASSAPASSTTYVQVDKIMDVNQPVFEDGIDLRTFGRETGGEAAEILRKQLVGGD